MPNISIVFLRIRLNTGEFAAHPFSNTDFAAALPFSKSKSLDARSTFVTVSPVIPEPLINKSHLSAITTLGYFNDNAKNAFTKES